MREVVRLPGAGCGFYLRGRCMYAEYMNPGLDSAFCCQVLARLERRFDALVERCELMGIGLEAAGRIWQGWGGDVVDWTCPEYALGAGDASGRCAHFVEGLCLLRFPCCGGRCRHYELARPGRNFEE